MLKGNPPLCTPVERQSTLWPPVKNRSHRAKAEEKVFKVLL